MATAKEKVGAKRAPNEHAPRTRAERVVRAVLDATIEELGRVGFAALAIDDVARRAGVNKTTVYRRWPTKSALAQAAFEQFGESVAAPDTGTLRGDLRALIRSRIQLAKTPRGRALMRGIHAEALGPELLAISRRMRQRDLAVYERIFSRSRARGELRRDVDDVLLMSLLEGVFMVRFLHDGKIATAAEVDRVIDLVLRGALT